MAFDSGNLGNLEARQFNDEEGFENVLHMYSGPQVLIEDVRKYNFADFKNRFDTKDSGPFAIDVLVSGSLLQQEILAEYKVRQKSRWPAAVGQPERPGSRHSTRVSAPAALSNRNQVCRPHISRLIEALILKLSPARY
jgi:hypothetical protein